MLIVYPSNFSITHFYIKISKSLENANCKTKYVSILLRDLDNLTFKSSLALPTNQLNFEFSEFENFMNKIK